MTTHDTLVTTFKLEDHYTGPAHKIVNATNAVNHALRGIKSGASGIGNVFTSIGQSIINGLKNPLTSVIAMLTGGALAAGVLAFSRSALDMASTFDMIERSFFGVLGSWDKVRSMMEYLKAYTVPSSFGLEPLAQAASLLARNKIDVGSFLPIIEMLALATGEGGSDKLLDAARLMMRLKGGDIAAAFSTQEGIGRFGVSKADIKEQGGKFDADGSFVGSVEEAFDVIARTVKAKLGGVKDAMAGSMEATFSNAATAVQMALADIGKVFYVAIAPILTSVSNIITNLSKSGAITKWAEQIASVFNMDPVKNPLVQAAVMFVSALQEVPNIWEYVKLGFMTMANSVTTFFNVIMQNMNRVIAIVNNVIDAFNAFQAVATVGIASPIGKLSGMGGAAMPFSQDAVNNQFWATQSATGGRAPGQMVKDRFGRNMDAFSAAAGQTSGGIPEPPYTGGGASDPLREIADNTRRTAVANEQMLKDYQSAIFGGSALGSKGVSAREVAGIRGSNPGGSDFNSKVEQATNLLKEAVLGLVSKQARGY